MRILKIAGVIAALTPIVYCGGLVIFFYFFVELGGLLGDMGRWDRMWALGLGPTVLGLGTIGLLFSIPLVWKIIRLFRGPRPPEPRSRRPDTPAPPETGEADADAMIARYLAKRPDDAAPRSPSPRAPSAKPASFGRRGA